MPDTEIKAGGNYMGATPRSRPEASATTDTSRPFQLSARTCALVAPSIFAVAVVPAAALAQNRYGIAEQTGTFSGADTVSYTNCLSVPNYPPDFVNHDLWVVNGNASVWVEAGIIQGWFAADDFGNAHTAATPRLFWAEQTNRGFFSHLGPSAPVGHWYMHQIKQDAPGSGKWAVKVGDPDDGPYFTASTVTNLPFASAIQAGTEATTTAARNRAQHVTLRYYNSAGQQSSDWRVGTRNAWIRQNSPPYAAWKNNGQNSALNSWSQAC